MFNGLVPIGDRRLDILLLPATLALGATLIAYSLDVLPGNANLLAAIGGSLATLLGASAARKLLAKRKRFVVYEVEAEDVRNASRRLRVIGDLLQALARSGATTAVIHVCGIRGCKLVLLLPNVEGIDNIMHGLLAGLRVRKHVVDDPSRLFALLNGGRGEALHDVVILASHTGEGESVTRGEVLIGISEDGAPVYASVDEFWRHAGIFGTTGSGKSTTTAFITSQLARHVRVIVFDWHGEYEALYRNLGIKNVKIVDPPRLPLIPEDLDLEIAVDVIEDTFDLTRHQSMLLYQALKSMNRRDAIPTDMDQFIDSLLATIEVQGSIPSRAELEIRAALERRLRSLMTGEGEKYFTVTGLVEIPEDKGLYVIRVNKIMLLPLRRVYVRMILAYLFYTAIAKNRILNTVAVLEEAQNIASSDTRTIPSILAEARKRKLGLIIVSQSPSSLHPSIMKNTNIRIVHTLKSAQDISVVARSMSLSPELRSKLPKLPTGVAVVDTPQLESPVLVRIPVEFAKQPPP